MRARKDIEINFTNIWRNVGITVTYSTEMWTASNIRVTYSTEVWTVSNVRVTYISEVWTVSSQPHQSIHIEVAKFSGKH